MASTGSWDRVSPRRAQRTVDGRSPRPRPQSKQVPPSIQETAGDQLPSHAAAAAAMLQRAAVVTVLSPVFAFSAGAAPATSHTLYWDPTPAKAPSCSRPRTWLSELLRSAAHIHRGQSLS